MKQTFAKAALPLALGVFLATGMQPPAARAAWDDFPTNPSPSVFVFNVRPSYNNLPPPVARDMLSREIADLARRLHEPVYFHRLKQDAPGAPEIYVECSHNFINQVRRLPHFGFLMKALPMRVPALATTQRDPELQKLYGVTNPAPGLKP